MNLFALDLVPIFYPLASYHISYIVRGPKTLICLPSYLLNIYYQLVKKDILLIK